jgi:hypothetical protein
MQSYRGGKKICGTFLGIIVVTSLLFSTTGGAADTLTATDWQYLKLIGYEDRSYALEKATKGQLKHLHKLINNRRISTQRKLDLVNSYLFAIGIEAPLR